MKRKNGNNRIFWIVLVAVILMTAVTAAFVAAFLPDKAGGDAPVTTIGETVTAEGTDTAITTDGTVGLEQTSAVTTAATTTAEPIPQEDRLPNMPELRDHALLWGRDEGVCHTLTGDVLITVIMVDDPAGAWTDEAIEQRKTFIENEAAALSAEAEKYGAELNITVEYLRSAVDITLDRDDTAEWTKKAFRAAGISLIGNPTENFIKNRGVAEAPVVFCMNSFGRDFSTPSVARLPEYVFLYEDCDAFKHELLHLFGARDYYYPEEVWNAAEKYFPGSIMANSSDSAIDSLTAYLIGWTDELSAEAIAFLEETAHLTPEYIKESVEAQNTTGTVTIRTGAGLYTGEMADGVICGKGRLVYDMGDVYDGEWSENRQHGHGVYTYASGDVYDGEWVEGKKHGYGKYTFADGRVYEGDFADGVISGYGKLTRADGSVVEGEWANGEFVG